MSLWDKHFFLGLLDVLLVGLLLLFIALVTPFEVAFLPAAEAPDEPLFVVNRLLDAVFIIDLCLQFFLMQPVSDAEHGVRWLDQRPQVGPHVT